MRSQPLIFTLIRRDGGTQPRAAIDDATANEYVDDLKNGANFPAVTVFYDGADYWLADGFHRVEASIKAGFSEINTLVKQGTRRDVVLYSVVKAYKLKAGAVTIDGVISRFFDREYNQKPITTDDICLNLSSNLKQFSSLSCSVYFKGVLRSRSLRDRSNSLSYAD